MQRAVPRPVYVRSHVCQLRSNHVGAGYSNLDNGYAGLVLMNHGEWFGDPVRAEGSATDESGEITEDPALRSRD